MHGLAAAVHLSAATTTTTTGTTTPQTAATSNDGHPTDVAAGDPLSPASAPTIRACPRVRHRSSDDNGRGAMTTSAADRSRVLARVCESELAAVRRASSGSSAGAPNGAAAAAQAMRRHGAAAAASGGRLPAHSDQVLCNSYSKSAGARSEAVGINAAGAGAADGDDNGEDPYAELEFYLENVKVSSTMGYIRCVFVAQKMESRRCCTLRLGNVFGLFDAAQHGAHV